jgi:hypothetical protein
MTLQPSPRRSFGESSGLASARGFVRAIVPSFVIGQTMSAPAISEDSVRRASRILASTRDARVLADEIALP